MSDINRRASDSSVHLVHDHVCPNCKRHYTCNCAVNSPGGSLVCIDCERGNYTPLIHGGVGTKAEA